MNDATLKKPAALEIRDRLESTVVFANDVRERASQKLSDISLCASPDGEATKIAVKDMPVYFQNLNELLSSLNAHLAAINDQLNRVEF